MPSLPDLLPGEGAVTVGGVNRQVRALKARAYGRLLRRYPVIAKLSAGIDVPAEEAGIVMFEAAPALIAAAMGRGEDEKFEEEIAAALEIDEVQPAIDAIMKLTVRPAPAGPFVEAAAGNGAARSGKAAATK